MGPSQSNDRPTETPNSATARIIGFANTNNTCYINSIMQSLYWNKDFRDKILSIKEVNEKDSMLRAIAVLFYNISQKKKSCTMSLSDFVYTIKRSNQEFNNEDHHDAHEFLTWLLDNLEQNLRTEQTKYKNKIDSTLIADLFSGKQSNSTKCLYCENVTEMKETYYHLSLDVEQNTSLTYCLKNYFGKELLRSNDKFYCAQCNCLQEAVKQVKLETLPKILIIQLKRFKMKNHTEQQKLNYLVNIPMDINVDFLLRKGDNAQDSYYTLRTIVVHAGSRSDYGHYYTLVRNHNRWIVLNDDKCNYLTVSIDEFFGNPDEEQMSNGQCAYLLFFEMNNSDR